MKNAASGSRGKADFLIGKENKEVSRSATTRTHDHNGYRGDADLWVHICLVLSNLKLTAKCHDHTMIHICICF